MAQLAIYLDVETAKKLDEAASRDGISRSAWVRKAIENQLEIRFPESYFDVLGTWEDDRDAEQIMRDIREHGADAGREKMDR